MSLKEIKLFVKNKTQAKRISSLLGIQVEFEGKKYFSGMETKERSERNKEVEYEEKVGSLDILHKYI